MSAYRAQKLVLGNETGGGGGKQHRTKRRKKSATVEELFRRRVQEVVQGKQIFN